MTTLLHERAVARQPRQHRAKERFDQVLDAAQALLREGGLNAFSIPALAERLGYTRASIYKFFPTPYAVLNELAQRCLGQLESQLNSRASEVLTRPWPEAMRELVWGAAKFYNGNPVARLLVLGGPVSDDSYRAQEYTIQRLGKLARELLLARGIVLPKARPDAATLLVEIGTTCLRLSQFLHGEITNEYREEAYHAMYAYLQRYAAGTDKRRPRPAANG
jgi:AcrR family transcriptional regulator